LKKETKKNEFEKAKRINDLQIIFKYQFSRDKLG